MLMIVVLGAMFATQDKEFLDLLDRKTDEYLDKMEE